MKVKKSTSFNKWVEKHSRLIFAIVTLLLAGGMMYFFWVNQPPDFFLSARISHLPGDAEHILILTADVSIPLSDNDKDVLTELSDSIPLTLFLSIDQASSDIESDFEFLSSLNADYGIYSELDFASMPYDKQEDFLWKQKDYLVGLDIRGFRTNSLTYDTLLAVENAQLDFFAGFTEANEPDHPDSLLGGKMRMVFFPMAGQGLSEHQEVWTLDVPLQSNTLSALDSLLQNDSILKWSMGETTDWILQKEKMGVEISSDLKELVSTIRLTSLQENTTLILTSNLKAQNVSYGNQSFDYYYRSGSLHIPTPDSRTFQVFWEKP